MQTENAELMQMQLLVCHVWLFGCEATVLLVILIILAASGRIVSLEMLCVCVWDIRGFGSLVVTAAALVLGVVIVVVVLVVAAPAVLGREADHGGGDGGHGGHCDGCCGGLVTWGRVLVFECVGGEW
jgi:hypothetical protein